MTAFDNVCAALERDGFTVTGSSTSARAQCPHHQSRGLTLSIRRIDDRAAVKCFAGCDTVDVLASIDLKLRDLYDKPRCGTAPTSPRSMTPWQEACASIGLRNPPPIEHLLNRMAFEHIKEGGWDS